MTSFPDIVIGRPGADDVLDLPFGIFTVRISGDQTAGALSVVDSILAPGAVGAAPHIHHGHEEYFLITAGEVTFETADGVLTVGAGGAVSVPRGRPHGYRNTSTEPARLTTVFTPAGYENYFRAVAEASASGEEITPELLAALRAPHRTTSSPLDLPPHRPSGG
ncbi:cupin domain-containing protein [Kribbella flavida]|uniref:cupin domain-containing protein n=1 Tax=Kribbella flavida TaxID=182640 RepID=UPI00019BD38E|nr:cupin domain-containing protein [Kribbella flavida]